MDKNESTRLWRQKNKEHIAKYKREYNRRNKDKVKKWNATYGRKNRKKIMARQAIWNKANVDTVKNYKRSHAEKHKVRVKKLHDEWRAANKPRLAEYKQKYYYSNKEKIAISAKTYRTKNREKITQYVLKRLKTDIQYRLTSALRARTRMALKAKIASKKASTLHLCGCTISELKTHIENQFEPWMTWDNWSRDGWHIDHIVPCSSFDLTKESEQLKCFHYTNLRPLAAIENIRKSNKILPVTG
jgi:hypothetical protein